QVGDVDAIEQHTAGIGRDRTRHYAEQRGLAGAVRPDDAERLTFRERKVKPIGNNDGAETLGDFFKGEDGRHGHISGRRPRASVAKGGTTAERHYDNSSSFPPSGMFFAVSFWVMTRSNALPLRCHWPETSGVFDTFLTGPPAQRTGP